MADAELHEDIGALKAQMVTLTETVKGQSAKIDTLNERFAKAEGFGRAIMVVIGLAGGAVGAGIVKVLSLISIRGGP